MPDKTLPQKMKVVDFWKFAVLGHAILVILLAALFLSRSIVFVFPIITWVLIVIVGWPISFHMLKRAHGPDNWVKTAVLLSGGIFVIAGSIMLWAIMQERKLV